MPRPRPRPSHTRATRLHTRAPDFVRPYRTYAPWTPWNSAILGVSNNDLRISRRVALEVRLGPLQATAPFFVVPGASFPALLGLKFLCEHEDGVSLAQHALIFEGHSNSIPSPVTVRASFPLAPWLRKSCPRLTPPLGSARPCRARPPRVPQLPRLLSTASPPPTRKLSIPTQVSAGVVEPEELTQLRHSSTNSATASMTGARLSRPPAYSQPAWTPTPPPISTSSRRLSPAMRRVVRDAVADLGAKGITVPSTGCWSAPTVMVRKASGAWRRCCDYRAITKHVWIPQQPLPRADDILASCNGKRYFPVLDMCQGFYQIEIAEEDRPRLASPPQTANESIAVSPLVLPPAQP
ncbi:hypothetical protein ACSSS7_001395 [Eimeria intestinalis]